MIGPKTDNSIGSGAGNIQIGHNTGTIQIGLSQEWHQAELERAIKRKTADLERAHTAEKALIQCQLDALRLRMLDLETDYRARLVELAETKALLQRYDNLIDRARYDEAIAALDRGESALAESILSDLAARASARREDAAREEAKLVFKLGEIAEGRVDWAAAANHYARAAELAPDFERLYKACELAGQAGDFAAALRHGDALVRLARAGTDHLQLITAINAHAGTLSGVGRYDEAEQFHREALAIGFDTLGPRDPIVANSLGNLAGVLLAMGRHFEAEPLARKSLNIRCKALGRRHWHVANSLNTLAGLLQETGRYAEAERLYRLAIGISREALGPRHPYVAICIYNLAQLLLTTGRYTEAEPLSRDALEIWCETLGPRHPNVARARNSFAGLLEATGRVAEAVPMFLEALGIIRSSLGDTHPNTRMVARNTLLHLRRHAPDHPDLPRLAVTFPDL